MAKIARGKDPYANTSAESATGTSNDAKMDIGKSINIIILNLTYCCMYIIDRKISTSAAKHLGYKTSPNKAPSKTQQVAPNHHRPSQRLTTTRLATMTMRMRNIRMGQLRTTMMRMEQMECSLLT